ncbi:MAG: threonine synthase [Sphaerochaetaceae bacterium]|jgi:threonine synthase|nr:threonine synthase [Sphaerochaetaceae bacterium]MDX9939539.1 threonine synthase [Sphaerochaetaceae bacterium]
MQFVSTRGQSPAVTASEAILQGLAVDGGLYVPAWFPHLAIESLLGATSYPELAFEVLAPFFVGDELEHDLAEICVDAFDFPVPLHWYDEKQAVLELFWGPTAAFKDFGARFLAASMQRLLEKRNRKLTILVATSGDTGGAVAAAFHKRPGITVKVLFPKGKVSKRQEKQLTCWGDNVEAYAVRGTFDDCQRMVKDAFMDRRLVARHGLSSANSINLGRLLPQMVYAFHAALEMFVRTGKETTAIIPSGNVGNSCASYWAKVCGAPISRIVLALNENRPILDYLHTGDYRKRPSIQTLANAMDVGDPSNMERLTHLFGSHEGFSKEVSAYSVDDETIRKTIGRVHAERSYVVCPHTATGEWVRDQVLASGPTVVYATAHPAKFETTVEPVIGCEVPVPVQLSALFDKPSSCREIEADHTLLFS